MKIEECELPGVGTRYDVELPEGDYLTIVIHTTGRREVYLKDEPGEDGELLLDLDESEARMIAGILQGMYLLPEDAADVDRIFHELEIEDDDSE
jgi:TrkA domain protein